MSTKRNKKSTKATKSSDMEVQYPFNEVYRDHVAGLQYYGHQTIDIKPNDEVKLFHDRGNMHSKHAIAVYVRGVKIGHVKDVNARVLIENREAFNWRASVVSYNPTNPTWQMCVIKIERQPKPLVYAPTPAEGIPFDMA